MNNLNLVSIKKVYNFSFNAKDIFNNQTMLNALRSYFISDLCAYDFEQSLIEFLHCECYGGNNSVLFPLDGINILSSFFVEYDFNLNDDGFCYLTLSHYITKEITQ